MGQGQSQDSVGGKSILYLPGFIRSRVLWSIGEAERIKGSPGRMAEVAAVFHMNYTTMINQGYLNAFMQNLYREDLFYVDKQFNFWSLKKPEGENPLLFETFSERFRRMFPGYTLDSEMRVRAGPDTKVNNLNELVALFRSKDAQLWEQNKDLFDGHMRFLDNSPNKSNKVAFASFPRSGNSFLRKYLEMLTGIATGADNTLHVNVHLQMQNLKGEWCVDDTVWIAKTHSPWIMPDAPSFLANKMIVIVRNPTEVIISWLNLVATCSHNVKQPFDVEKDYPNYWDWWVEDCSRYMAAWYQTYIQEAKMRKVPILFIRFEDLVTDPKSQLTNIMRFLCGIKQIEGTNAERRVQEVIDKGTAATRTYDLKESTLKFDANKVRYTQKQLDLIQERMKEMMFMFGYATTEAEPDNNTAFYNFGKNDPMGARHKSFRTLNENMIDWVCSLDDADLAKFQYLTSDPAKEVPLMDFASSIKATRAISHNAQMSLYGRVLEDVN